MHSWFILIIEIFFLVGRIAVNLTQELDIDTQKTHRTRKNKTISAIMSHKVILLARIFWQVLGLENTKD